MNTLRSRFAWLNVLCAFALAGCNTTEPFFLHDDGDLSHYLDAATDISYPDLQHQTLPDAAQTHAPLHIENSEVGEQWELTLEEAISIAFQNAQVLRTLGGRVSQPVGQSAGSPPESLTFNPDFAPTTYDVAVQETSSTGVEAALSNFDAQLETRFSWDRTDRPQNVSADNPVLVPLVQRDAVSYQTQISKRTASGTQWFARNVTERTADNSLFRQLSTDWLTAFEFEARHPILRGSGVQVNRVPVMLARINTDIAISDFEINVRDFVFEIEQAYWNLYFHYHNLDAARTGFASAHATWKQTNTRGETGKGGGEASNEAQSRAQYFSFKSRLQQAKSDLLAQESRLRYLLGIAATDGRLIRPVDQPTRARVEFDWYDIKNEALTRSPELRRQKWRIKQNQLQLIAARNQLLPQFDAVALYRFLGMGDELTRLGSRFGPNFLERESYASDNLLEGDFGEFQLGFTYQQPIGYRAEMTQVRNTQLQLRRSEKKLDDEELEITHQLSAAVRRLRDNYRIAQTQFNTLKAYRDQVQASQTAYEYAQSVPLDVVLDAQSRQAQAETDYFRALAQYNLAIAEVHHRKGSLLEYNGIALAEGPWTSKAYYDSHQRARQRDGSYYLDYGFSRPAVVSRGPVPRYSSNPPSVAGAPAPTMSQDGVSSEIEYPIDNSTIYGESYTPSEGMPIGLPTDSLRIDGAPVGGVEIVPSDGLPIEAAATPSADGDAVWGTLGL